MNTSAIIVVALILFTVGESNASCDCDYRRGGCVISRPPPKNLACKCRYKGFWTCGGDLITCYDMTNRYCRHPDYSKRTCLFGGGDCGGYRK